MNSLLFPITLIFLLHLPCLALAETAGAANKPLDALLPKTESKPLQASPLFAGRGDGVTTCPVTGEKIISKKLKLDLHGRTVYFCCHGCLKAAKAQPDKFVKPTMSEQKQAVKAFLAKANPADSEEFCNE
jgi:YHS domain-containing protein